MSKIDKAIEFLKNKLTYNGCTYAGQFSYEQHKHLFALLESAKAEPAELNADKVQLENDACVARGENDRLTAEKQTQAERIAELERIAKLELEAVTQLSRNAGVSESAIQAHISTFEQALKKEKP